MIKFLLTIVVTLSSLALANTGTYSPTIDDAGFSYYRPSGSTANTTTRDWTIGVQDDELVVRISHEASSGALIHRFTSIDRLPSEIMERLYGNSPANWTYEVRREREAELERLRTLAGMSPLNSGWSVVHSRTPLDQAVAAYEDWFLANGLTLSADPANTVANVRPFTLSGLAQDMRVVFTAQGTGVRVFMVDN
jgi:hypothetical protein